MDTEASILEHPYWNELNLVKFARASSSNRVVEFYVPDDVKKYALEIKICCVVCNKPNLFCPLKDVQVSPRISKLVYAPTCSEECENSKEARKHMRLIASHCMQAKPKVTEYEMMPEYVDVPKYGAGTLQNAIDVFRKELPKDGMDCQLCGRHGKFQPRPFNGAMVNALQWIANQGGPTHEYVDVPRKAPKWITRSNQHSTAALWKLVERMPIAQERAQMKAAGKKGKCSGLWRITPDGLDFLAGHKLIKSHVVTYNDAIQGWSKHDVSVHDVVHGHYSFDYQKDIIESTVEGGI